MSVEVADFEIDVLDRSRETPVVVDFWAPWCGPCRVLGPVLDKLAGQAEGRWVLAKLNTDENPEVSMRYGIRGIPAVKLFVDGEVSAEFTGALPEHAVKRWLDENLPSEDRASMAHAASLLDEGRVSEAREVLEDLDSDEARVLLARLIVFTDPEKAENLVSSIEPDEPSVRNVVDAVHEIAERLMADDAELPPGPGNEIFQKVLEHLKAGRLDEAVSGLISLLQSDRFYHDDAARKLGIALFTILGPEDPVTRRHRRTFDMYLY